MTDVTLRGESRQTRGLARFTPHRWQGLCLAQEQPRWAAPCVSKDRSYSWQDPVLLPQFRLIWKEASTTTAGADGGIISYCPLAWPNNHEHGTVPNPPLSRAIQVTCSDDRLLVVRVKRGELGAGVRAVLPWGEAGRALRASSSKVTPLLATRSMAPSPQVHAKSSQMERPAEVTT